MPRPVWSRHLSFLAFALAVAIAPGVAADAETSAWTPLFNGRDLSGWETYLGPQYDTEKREFAGEPVGLNRDPDRVFTVVAIDGAPAIRVSGRDFGGFSTLAEFENYHLRLQFKWGQDRHPPRAQAPRDSGLLYHATGPHAAEWFFWLQSIEFQVQEHDCGDFWGVGGTSATVSTRRDVVMQRENGQPVEREIFTFDPAGELREFRRGTPPGGHCRKWPDAEHPTGAWNTLDLYCFGDTSLHVVNGVLTMVLHNLRGPDDHGGFVPLTKGRIQIQSEGAEVFYRAIAIRPIDRLPSLPVAGAN
jgi:hypothetical protein